MDLVSCRFTPLSMNNLEEFSRRDAGEGLREAFSRRGAEEGMNQELRNSENILENRRT